ncbi:hypothetical protein EDD53_2399 [Pacificibacter maritimus]|uniref:FlgN protein n=1 Tax=Pacificibacter maritimus TaxID=762213 RepID=A0A3N4UC58_9RHOB|nr:hypothetical protein [Pacificibacter maritimus]RPE64639.1 hypothetical protein EDD53_2399 [Pacificibacter maritimus]
MGLFNAMRPVSALIELLEKEHDAIIKGQFSVLVDVSEPKESLMQALSRVSPNEADLNVLKKLSERNRKLLVASAHGLKSARKRLADLKAPLPSFQTYGPSGSRADMVNKSLTIKKKI